MGKTALILILGLSVSLQFLKNSLYQKPLEAVETVGSYYSKSTSKNVAHSAMNDYLRKLYQNKNLRGTFTESNKYLEGSVDTVSISSSSATTTNGDSISVSVVAHYGGHSSRIEVTVLGSSFTIPPITSALAYTGDNSEIDVNGAFIIDGRNHDIDGNLSNSCVNLPGVAVKTGTDSVDIEDNQLKKKDKKRIKGIGPDPSIHVRETVDPSTYSSFIESVADCTLQTGTYAGKITFGNEGSPVIVYGSGDIHFSGRVAGYGIILVDGTIRLTGNFDWYGLMAIIGSDEVLFNSTGVSRVVGGVVLGGTNKSSRIRGNADLLYSCEAISNMQMNTSGLLNFNMLSWYE
jgi:hypothetical protein